MEAAAAAAADAAAAAAAAREAAAALVSAGVASDSTQGGLRGTGGGMFASFGSLVSVGERDDNEAGERGR